MKKSKRENLLSPSSSWRENHNPPRRNSNSSAVSSGCLPGFFNLFLSTFNFSSNRRKSITLGSKKREQKTDVVYASPPQDSSNDDGEGMVAPQVPRNEGEGDAARVSLVGALEKCDRDLEELRRTIDVIKTTCILQKKLEVSPATARENLKLSGTVAGDVVVGTQRNNQNTKTTLHETDTDTMLSMMSHHEYCYKDNKTYKVNNINQITRPDHYDIHDVVIAKRASSMTTDTRGTLPLQVVRRVRRSLMESVNQVCDDVASGQRREVAKIGLALHDHICRDLIAETVRELSFFDYDDDEEAYKSAVSSGTVCYRGRGGPRHIRRGSSNSLPLDACRRRLVF